jgi:hypothetical protein
VPAPSAPPTGSKAADAVACALARLWTSTLNVVGKVPPTAVAVTYLVSEDVVATPFQPVTLVSLPAASCNVETSDLIWPNAEILVLTVAACSLSVSRGRFSRATNWEMMLLTSNPFVPTPGDEMVAIQTS